MFNFKRMLDISIVGYSIFILLIAGPLQYFFEFVQFQWLLSIFGASLILFSFFTKCLYGNRFAHLDYLIITWWVLLFMSTLLNSQPLVDSLVGLRIYLPFYGVYTYLTFCKPSLKILQTVFNTSLGVAVIQWLFSLYQKTYIVPMRIAANVPGSPWDSVVGSFGGDKFGGGESGSLGIFLSVMFILLFAFIKNRIISPKIFYFMFINLFISVLLTESKVVVLMIPLGIFIVYKDLFYKNKFKFILWSFVVFTSIIGVLATYNYFYWQMDSNLGFIQSIISRMFYSFDPDFQASSLNLGRVGSLVYWWIKHDIGSPLLLLFGHGLASAVSSSTIIGEGVAVRNTGITLDVTGISKLLWETGLLGSLLFFYIFLNGFKHAGCLKKNPVIPHWHRATMAGVEASILILIFSVFYEVTIVSSPPMQFIAMFFLGYISYWRGVIVEQTRLVPRQNCS